MLLLTYDRRSVSNMKNEYVTEENIFKMIKRKFTRTKNEHTLIGLNVCDRGSIEKTFNRRTEAINE